MDWESQLWIAVQYGALFDISYIGVFVTRLLLIYNLYTSLVQRGTRFVVIAICFVEKECDVWKRFAQRCQTRIYKFNFCSIITKIEHLSQTPHPLAKDEAVKVIQNKI